MYEVLRAKYTVDLDLPGLEIYSFHPLVHTARPGNLACTARTNAQQCMCLCMYAVPYEVHSITVRTRTAFAESTAPETGILSCKVGHPTYMPVRLAPAPPKAFCYRVLRTPYVLRTLYCDARSMRVPGKSFRPWQKNITDRERTYESDRTLHALHAKLPRTVLAVHPSSIYTSVSVLFCPLFCLLIFPVFPSLSSLSSCEVIPISPSDPRSRLRPEGKAVKESGKCL